LWRNAGWGLSLLHHRNADDDPLLDRHLSQLYGFPKRRDKKQQDGMKLIEPLLGRHAMGRWLNRR
jgi:hypothetical protein